MRFVATRKKCTTQSFPALVQRSYRDGAHPCSDVMANYLAKILATKRLSKILATRRLSELPVAMPPTPPSGSAQSSESCAHQCICDLSGGSSRVPNFVTALNSSTAVSTIQQEFRMFVRATLGQGMPLWQPTSSTS